MLDANREIHALEGGRLATETPVDFLIYHAKALPNHAVERLVKSCGYKVALDILKELRSAKTELIVLEE